MIYYCSRCNCEQERFKTDIRKSKKEWVYVNSSGKRIDGLLCQDCRNARQREQRRKNKNRITNKYEKTISGFLMRKYRNMTSRVFGIQKQKHHLYSGIELLSKDEFYTWAINHADFHQMFEIYKNSGFQRKLCPTVDRIDSLKGYIVSNMRWLTHSQNSSLGAISKRNKTRAVLVDNSKSMGPLD